MRFNLIVSAVLIIASAAMFGCGSKEQSGNEKGELVARVNDWKLTSSDLDELIENLPEKQRSQYSTPSGRSRLADMIVEEELYYEDGLKKKLDRNPDVEKLIDQAKRRVIISEYFKRYVNTKARPTDEEMHDYYEKHKDRFTIQPVLKAQHIFSKDREKLVELKKRIENGEKMTNLAHKYSEDEITIRDGGDLGYFNPGGYVRFIGYSKKWSDAVSALGLGIVSDPIEFEKGYSIVRVNSRKPAQLKPYEEVKSEILGVLTNQRIDEVRKNVVKDLEKQNKVENYLAEELSLTERSPEELWNLAQTSTDSHRRLDAYQEIVDKHSDSKYASQALFMIGFVYAEELKDQYNADKTFREVVQKYPDTDIARSAQWMLKNLGKPMPDFENLDELNKKILNESK
jgi:peptidyl-prolyl cis-trans isomerase C